MRAYFKPRVWPDMAQQTLLLSGRVVDWRDPIILICCKKVAVRNSHLAYDLACLAWKKWPCGI